jgi:hypothetical protein
VARQLLLPTDVNRALKIWRFERDVDPRRAVSVSRDELEPPVLSGHVVADEGDVIRIVVADGVAVGPGALFYVGRHGLFELDGPFGGKPGAEVTLKAWPSR